MDRWEIALGGTFFVLSFLEKHNFFIAMRLLLFKGSFRALGFLGGLLLVGGLLVGCGGGSPGVSFENIKDGDRLKAPFILEMGVSGMKVAPAGKVVEGEGHHHLLINQSHWPLGSVIPATDTTIHYGKGQTEVEVDLEPGNYILSLQFADGVHASYGQEMAASVNVVVE